MDLFQVIISNDACLTATLIKLEHSSALTYYDRLYYWVKF